MTKISSSPRSLNKVSLFIYFGLLLFVIVSMQLAGGLNDPEVLFLIGAYLFFGAIFGLATFAMTRNLADEVFDGGEFLLIRFRDEEERILFSNIYDVSAWNNRVLPRISLKLATPGKFGAKVSFAPIKSRVATWTLDPFWMDPIVEDFLVRAEKARSAHGAA